MSATCSSCGAAIKWAVSAKSGKLIPLNARPSETGNIVAVNKITKLDVMPVAGAPPGDALEVRFLSKSEHVPATVERYVSHFATCPQAAQHRRDR